MLKFSHLCSTLTFGSVASESRQPAQSVTNRTKPGSREFDCDLCDASFNHQQNLIRHRKVINSDFNPP